jgi:hypothetical protein
MGGGSPVRLGRIRENFSHALTQNNHPQHSAHPVFAGRHKRSPRDFDAFMRSEAAKWEPVLKEANIKMQ